MTLNEEAQGRNADGQCVPLKRMVRQLLCLKLLFLAPRGLAFNKDSYDC